MALLTLLASAPALSIRMQAPAAAPTAAAPAAAASGKRLLVLGGHNSREALSELYVLEFHGERMSWYKPETAGEAPICGNRHATLLVEDVQYPHKSLLLVFAADMHDTFQTLYGLRYNDRVPMRWQASPKPARARPHRQP